jgi:hypothetical protein
VKGSTSASILGRHLSAHSASPKGKKAANRPGGDSGVWIGEMTFLDTLWDKEQLQIAEAIRKKQDSSTDKSSKDANNNEINNKESNTSTDKKQNVPLAIYTIVATEDCTIWRWSFEDMEKLMSKSVDMRGALTRAMTNAVVGKVVNMTISRAKVPQWTAWLGDWTREDGATVEIRRIETMPPDGPEENDDNISNTTPAAV